jgi:hypothetical protein
VRFFRPDGDHKGMTLGPKHVEPFNCGVARRRLDCAAEAADFIAAQREDRRPNMLDRVTTTVIGEPCDLRDPRRLRAPCERLSEEFCLPFAPQIGRLGRDDDLVTVGTWSRIFVSLDHRLEWTDADACNPVGAESGEDLEQDLALRRRCAFDPRLHPTNGCIR